jgi:DNA invertase Pin-like site-specific DNA recombinase
MVDLGPSGPNYRAGHGSGEGERMTRVGYVWVGPLEHNSEFQRDLLFQRGVDTIYEDISARVATPIRTELTTALDSIGPADTLVVWRLDRLGSTSSNVLSLLELLGRRVAGRPRALSPTNVERVLMLKDQGATVREIAQELGTSRATVYRAIELAAVDALAVRPDEEERTSLTVRFGTPTFGDADALA